MQTTAVVIGAGHAGLATGVQLADEIRRSGVRIVGRIVDGVAQFSGSLANICALADLKMNRFLNRADQ